MSKLSENYIAVNEGKLAKSEFLRQSRQAFPGFINQFTSYDDAIKIFRNKGLLSEDIVYQCPGDKYPLEQIEKGLRYELEELGYYTPMSVPTPADYKKAKMKAIDNLGKDPLYYIKMDACCCDKCKQSQAEAEAKKGEDYKQKKAEGQMVKVEPGQRKVKPLQESAYSEKRESFSDKDKVMVQLVQAIMKKDNPETGKKYTQAEAKKKAEKMYKSHEAKKKAVNENWTSADDAAAAADAEANNEALKVFINWARQNAGTRTMPENGKDSETIDGMEFTWNFRKDWNQWQLCVDKDTWEKRLRGFQCLFSNCHDVRPTMTAQRNGIIEFNEWNSLFDNLYKRDAVNEGEGVPVDEKAMKKQFDQYVRFLTYCRDNGLKPNFGTWMNYMNAEKENIQEIGDTLKGQNAMGRLARRKAKQGDKAAEKEISDRAWDAAEETEKKGGVPKGASDNAYQMGRYLNMKESKMLKESISKAVTKVLSEAATANLAKLSDENASIQGIPAILNNLENVVTEIESFIIKEQTKIQDIFDSVGDIKNEDGIPVGYRFVQPIMNSLKQDLAPVLEKVNLDNIQLPAAPESLSQEENPDMAADPNADMAAPEEKRTVFAPRGEKPQPLAESKSNRRYTK